MSGITPEAALRVSAEHLSKMHGASDMVLILIAEADRLEAAAKTPGQVAYEAAYSGFPWREVSFVERARWERIEAAVIDHHVGPDRVVVDRANLEVVLNDARVSPSMAKVLREALS